MVGFADLRRSSMTKNARARGQAVDSEGWTLESHICRSCFGRLVSRRTETSRLYACSNCGLQGEGARPAVACCCGIKIRRSRGGGPPALVDAGVRCHPNRNPSPEFPAQIVASFGGVQADSDS